MIIAMKKNKLTSNKDKHLVVKDSQKLTSFFKKIYEKNEEKNVLEAEKPSCSYQKNQLNESPPAKKRCNWINDNCILQKENDNGCSKKPLKMESCSEKNVLSNKNILTKIKNSPSKVHHNEIPNASLVEKSSTKVKTPPKIKLHKSPAKHTSPRKLFIKSPIKISEFNVEIINNFVSITPSKSNKTVNKFLLTESPEKVQSSIFDYMKPSVSERSIEAQNTNEKTPTKSQVSVNLTPKNASAKIKLNFELNNSCCTDTKISVKNQFNDDLHQSNLSNLGEQFDDDWDELLLQEQTQPNYSLNLEDQLCKIISVDRNSQEVNVVVQSLENEEKGLCILRGIWTYLKLRPGVILNINAIYNLPNSQWFVDNNRGLVVYEPSHLLSTTSVVGGLFCKRKAYFSENFRGFEPPNKFMVLGTFIHELLQDALKNNYHSKEKLAQFVETKINSKDMIYQCYSSSVKPDEIKEEIDEYVLRVSNFICSYVKKSKDNAKNMKEKQNWVGQIDDIIDIEENIWCPQLGLKGKIDVTVESGRRIIPIEVKTGRASVSLEHRGQIMLYLIMMANIGYKVSSGLLLYLKEEVLREISITDNEKRDLIMLRNELAYYLTKNIDYRDGDISIEIPDPINHHSACSKCPYNVICCSFLKWENKDLKDFKHLNEVQSLVLSHLGQVHLDYFVQWNILLDLENQKCDDKKKLKDIYTIPPLERETVKGCCITFVKIKSVELDEFSQYNTTFEKNVPKTETNFYSSGIGLGSYIIISTDSRPAVATGFVSQIEKDYIIISLDRDLRKRYPNKMFHLDTYESSTSELFNKTSLTLIMGNDDKAKKLRELIIEKRLPTYQTKLSKSIIVKGSSILRSLNRAQQKAVLKALSANDYLLIQGMPGTGKTETLVAFVQILEKMNKTVLITSHTNSAVDNICIRLVDKGLKLLRLGSKARIHPKLQDYSEESLTKHITTLEELESAYNKPNVVAVTCLGSNHPVLSKRNFDFCIIDESTQIIQTSVFRVLCASDKFVLVGDPEQLPPVVKSKEAFERGLSESLFNRLQHPECLVKLNLNYRMNKRLTEVANFLTYDGELQVANDQVKEATLTLPKIQDFSSPVVNQWLTKTLNSSLSNSFQVLDTGSTWKSKQNFSLHKKLKITSVLENDGNINVVNSCEISLVLILTKALLKAGVAPTDIGIIAPYRLQILALNEVLKDEEIEIKTVDQFQGRDKKIIIFSCTKSKEILNSEDVDKFDILSDNRRLTVAITRAKHKFILIGDVEFISRYSPFKKLFSNLSQENFLKIYNETNFSWENIMNSVTI